MIETSKILKMHPGQLRFHKNTSYQRRKGSMTEEITEYKKGWITK